MAGKSQPNHPATRPPPAKRRPVIGLALMQGLSFLEKVRHGIVDYAQAHGGWTFSFMPENLTPSVDWLRHATRMDGAFALVTTAGDMRTARTLPFPVVNLAGHIDPGEIPSVMVDHRRIGRMAAEHLLGLGFKRLGYYGTGNMWYGCERYAGFSEAARRAGARCHPLIVHPDRQPPAHWRDQHRQLARWLLGLPKPVGILASIDLRAAMIVDVCLQAGLRVPDEVAVLGVDNDPAVCQLGPVALTSIARNDWKVGWEAAAMLDRAMAGAAPPQTPLLIEPEQVVPRKSTETMAVHDPFVADLLAELRRHLDKPFGVEWLVRHSGRSRRWLELRFREALGQPPLAVINRLRVARAKELLAGAGHEAMSLSDIAAQCGFADLRRLRLVFTKHTGMPPKRFRRAARNAGDPRHKSRSHPSSGAQLRGD
ncbi:MAG: DNA-binding transcriptional regulator [Opitutaceae bacterium]|nr:DNA-binding transcriptional regulator [Opitutaceae bacterium]